VAQAAQVGRERFQQVLYGKRTELFERDLDRDSVWFWIKVYELIARRKR